MLWQMQRSFEPRHTPGKRLLHGYGPLDTTTNDEQLAKG
jgi:hypothetical protein